MSVLGTFAAMRTAFATDPALGNDGYPAWPIAMVDANGFDDGLTGVPTPIEQFAITVSVDGSANGAEAYDVWLSQRTDEPTQQWFDIYRATGKSGSWTIEMTSVAADYLGLGDPGDALSLDDVKRALKYVTLYVQRISDQATQCFALLDLTLANQGED
jgi:hypothetical protein